MSRNWLFEIGTVGSPTYRIGLVTETYSGNPYTGVVDKNTFRGIQLNRIKYELNSFTKSNVSFDIIDNGSTYTTANIEDEPVIVRLLEDGVQTDSWRYKVETVTKAYNRITVNCIDYMSILLDGSWPLTDLVKDAFPEALLSGDDRYSSVDDDACIPIVFGTESYIPLQSIADSGLVYYLMGELDGNTFSVSRMTSPHSVDNQIEYTGGVTYTQSTQSGIRTFRPSFDGGSTYKFWRSGANRVPPIVKYTDSNYSGTDNPVDIIKLILKDFGAVDADFDSSWATTATTVGTTRGISFSRGYYKHVDRKKLLLNLIAIADVNITFGETFSVAVNAKASQATITSASVVKSRIEDIGTFRRTKVKPGLNDSGYIQFNKSNVPQDKPIKAKVTASSGTSDPVSTVLDCTGIHDSQEAQKMGTLYFQKKLLKNGEISFKGIPSLISLVPGDVITINDTMYNGSTVALVDTMLINSDTTIDFKCITYSAALQDWGDLAPSAITDTVEDVSSTTEVSTYEQSTDYTDGLWDGTDTSINFAAIIDAAIAGGNALVTAGTDLNDTLLQNINVQNGGNLTIENGGDIEILSGGDINVASGGDVNIASGGNIAIASGGDITVASGGSFTGYGSTAVTIASGGTMTIASGGTMTIASGSTMNIYGSTGLNIQSGGDINIKSGGDINIEDGGNLIMEDGGTFELRSDADSTALLTFYNSVANDYFDFQLTSTGYLRLQPRQTSTGILLGENTYTGQVVLQAKTAGTIGLYTGAAAENNYIRLDDTICSIVLNNTSGFSFSSADQAFSTTTGDDLGKSGSRWGVMYGTTLNISGDATISGELKPESVTINGGTPVSTVSLLVRGTGTGANYTLLCENSSGTDKFFVTDAGNSTLAGTFTANALSGSCITDSTSITSDTTAASATAVKSAYDTGNHSHPYLSTSHNTDSSAHTGYTLNVNLSGDTTVSGDFDPTSSSYDLGSHTPWDYIIGSKLVAGGAAPSSAASIRSEGPGTTTSTYSLLCENSAGTDRFYVKDNGQAWGSHNLSVDSLTERSSRELKQDIATIPDLSIPELLKINPVTYKFKKEGAVTQSGFIAEEVQDIFPLAVSETVDEERNPVLGIQSSAIMPYVIKGQQEQQAYIDAVGDRVETVESIIFSLVSKVETLEATIINLRGAKS